MKFVLEEFLIKKIIVIIIVFIIFIEYILLCKSFFSDLSVDATKTEEIVKTDFGDEFLFKYEYSDFPDSETSVYIIDDKKEIAYFVIEDKPNKPELLNLINISNIKCYEVYNLLLYSVNNDDFEYVDVDRINEYSPEEHQSLVQVCKALVNQNEWKWVKACAIFLINSGNIDIMGRLQNYAKGIFTQEEIEINKNSEVTKGDMQSFSKNLLQKESSLSDTPIPTITPTMAPIIATEDRLNEYLCSEDEDILFSFKIAKTNKTVSICVSKDQPDYIIYRYGVKDNVELVYPEIKDADSWNKFTYSYYLRGGGAGNEGLDLNYLAFENGGRDYKIYEEYSSVDNQTRVGITVTELETGKEKDIEGESDSIHGSLIDLRENPKVKIELP